MKAQLILENGKRFSGEMFGAIKDVVGEVVFSTSMVGYQEVLTNPSYTGKIVTMTFPLIGNYGINSEDMDADKVNLSAFIVREKCDEPSNFRMETTLEKFLEKENVVGLCGVDTRALTRTIRDCGSMRAVIVRGEPDDKTIKELFSSYDNSNATINTTTKEIFTVNETKNKHLAFIDMGAKDASLREINKMNFKVTVFPAFTDYNEILSTNPDMVFVSDGPGNPSDLQKTVENVKNIIGRVPVCAVGMGHIIVGMALGANVQKLKYGHNGSNQPVKNSLTQKVYITSQSHSYSLCDLPEDVIETFYNVNDKTCEGISHKTLPVRSIQFIPDPQPGNLDFGFLFDTLLEEVK